MLRWVTTHPRISSVSGRVATAAAVTTTTTTTSSATRSASSPSSANTTRRNNIISNSSNASNNNNMITSSSSLFLPSSAHQISQKRCASSGGGGSGMRSAELKDEEELVRVLGSQPRHVARRVRQMMATSRKRLSHFRNTVTYLMIVLQGKLQKQEITPEDAAVVVEGVLQECVDLGQSEMAHLLFRAALRFRKYGVLVSPKCVHALYSSFRGSALRGDGQESRRNLLGQLASEMKDQEDLKGLTIAAYIYAGQQKEASELHATIAASKLTHDDYCTMIQAYANTQNFSELEGLVLSASKIDREDFDSSAVYSTAIIAAQPEAQLQDTLLVECLENACKPSEAAIASIARRRLYHAMSLDESIAIESDLRQQLKLKDLGMGATTAFVMRCADFFSQNFDSSDQVMASKVQQLAAIVETCIENNEADQIEAAYPIALIRGFGALGQMDEMLAMIEKLKKNTMLVDFKMYDEALRWLSRGGSVKHMLEVKEQMEKEHIYHSTFTYISLLKGLGKFYPRLTQKYIDEARKSLPFFDERMYAQIVQSLTSLGEIEQVKEVYAEMLDRDARGRASFNPGSVAQLLFAFSSIEPKIFDEIVSLANRRGLFTNEFIQRAVITGYSNQKRAAELSNFVSQLPRKSFQIYLSLIQAYGKLDDPRGFDKVLEEMRSAQIPLNDTFFSIAADICARWRDSGRFQRMVELTQGAASASRKGYVSAKDPRTIARIAGAHAMMGDYETVGALWKDLRDSDAPIPMNVFNRFLEMTVRRNDLAFAQDVLEVMMTRVPPNPVTTTTVMDMLARMGRLHEVQVLLDEMCQTKNIQPTLVTFHHAMTAFAKVGDVAKLVALREKLQQMGLRENHITHNIMLTGFGKAQRFDSIPELLAERANQGVSLDTNCYEILLDIYAKARLTNELENTVQAILNRTISSSVNTEMVLDATDGTSNSNNSSNSHHQTVVTRTNDEDRANVMGAAANPLNPRILAAIATAYSHVGDVSNVEKFVGKLLAHPACKQSHIETCFLIYHRLRDMAKLDWLLSKYGGSEFVLNVCIAAFAKAGMHDRVATILEELQSKKYALHTNTAVVLSTLLLKAGKVDLAQTVLKFRRVSEAQQLRGSKHASGGGGDHHSDSAEGANNNNRRGGKSARKYMNGSTMSVNSSASNVGSEEVTVETSSTAPASVAEEEVFGVKE